jgi:gamma-glutamylcyclotransferase (GGCT)/AIG2-like uncharacterized protein YtfP
MKTDILYFAYGSNLNDKDRRRWFEEKGYEDPLEQAAAVAYLPDNELVFNYHSSSRQGGVLSIRPRIGQAVDGVLFKVRPNGWDLLDMKEGHPDYYQRRQVTVLVSEGYKFKAVTYEVRPELQEAEIVKPNPEYMKVVSDGLKKHGIGDQMLLAAAEGKRATLINCLFAYGTLMQGECRHHLIGGEENLEYILPADAAGDLINLGNYPAMIIPGELGYTVHGELFFLKEMEKNLKHLDGVEGFYGYDNPDSLYHRKLIEVSTGRPLIRRAWSYVWAENFDMGPRIESGNWRIR